MYGVSLPGSEWRTRNVAWARALGGGDQGYAGHPVQAGAAFAMTVVFAVAWVVALPVLLLWRLIRSGRQPEPSD